jgi:cytidyltransferase-like protein
VATVLTIGTFDLLHVGHLELLAGCRELAGGSGSVVVAVNRDAFVERYKGRRPVHRSSIASSSSAASPTSTPASSTWATRTAGSSSISSRRTTSRSATTGWIRGVTSDATSPSSASRPRGSQIAA